MKRVNYSLPTYLMSFPRSGSNFLQSIIEKSSGLRCRSMYDKFQSSSNYFLSLKSHAHSYEYLLDEIKHLLADAPKPSKLILLYRDPRDVMISYYEYTQVQQNTQIEQRAFLDTDDYFLAALLLRHVGDKLLSVRKAYKKHINSWFVEPLPEHLDCLVVKYENLIQEPQKEFQRIFDFLELRCSLAEQFLDVKVSLFSSELRQRGRAYGWKDSVSRYNTLLQEVNDVLRDEMIAIGYQPD